MKMNSAICLYYLLFAAQFLPFIAYSQTPLEFVYQNVLIENGQLVTNADIGIKMSLLENESDIILFSESHLTRTNSNGLYSVKVGSGQTISGSLLSINWAPIDYLLKTEVDFNGGTDYSFTVWDTIFSVPYALVSNNSGSSIQGPIGPVGNIGVPGINGVDGLSAYEIWLSNGNNGTEQDYLNSLMGQPGNNVADDQYLQVSSTNDTLKLQNGGYVIIPGISNVNTPNYINGYHSCGIGDIHNVFKSYGQLIDQDGNNYKTIQIGTQEWMAENLNVSHYRNGDTILNLINSDEWSFTSIGAWSHYENYEGAQCPFGKLYNWYAVSDSRNLCPAGWHVPSQADWSELISYLGGGTVAGGKLKSDNLYYGRDPSNTTTNSSGFSALFSGQRTSGGYFGGLAVYGLWWTCSMIAGSQLPNIYAHYIGLGYENGTALNTNDTYGSADAGYSVRCIRD
jgi:uncharacterized protein (TIGR02145 family)